MYETLIAIVSVHAQVCSIVEQLLDRTLNAIVEEVATEALRCFRQVKRFGMGGMLRVCLPFSPVSHFLIEVVCRLRWR
jgi:exocyst complex component 2